VALARTEHLTFSYPGSVAPALADVCVELGEGEVVALFGASGSGKSTLLRAFAGLVPHFHGGRFAGRVEVAGVDTRNATPAELAGTVASVFQDPEEQVVLTAVVREVAFGLENLGTAPDRILDVVEESLAAVGAAQLLSRRVTELSGGELQRVCLASALALRPRLLLLDEPTSQLDSEGADGFLELAAGLGVAVLISEQRPRRVLEQADRVLFLDAGRLVLDAPVAAAEEWLAANRPSWLGLPDLDENQPELGERVCSLRGASFSYRPGVPVVHGIDLELRRGEIVALSGRNGSGKTTVAKLAAGLLEPASGDVIRHGRAAMLIQDPGRYCVRERADEEVAMGVEADRGRAAPWLRAVGLDGLEARHPRDLSTGERERLALASVLAVEPDLLVLDEPTRGVDPLRKKVLADRLRRDASGRATLVVTHDQEFARAVADRTVSLEPEPALV
jgi:energy-coupling factor transport system ATP-binding protein